jgi:hypothetical protein
MSDPEDIIKHRDIRFCPLHPDPNQAQSALLLLTDAEGIHDIQYVDEICLRVAYDIRLLTLQSLEDVLVHLGFHLENTLLARMMRALYAYTEEAQRANLDCEDTDTTTMIFVRRYTTNYHGCRDKRPQHWRRYL